MWVKVPVFALKLFSKNKSLFLSVPFLGVAIRFLKLSSLHSSFKTLAQNSALTRLYLETPLPSFIVIPSV